MKRARLRCLCLVLRFLDGSCVLFVICMISSVLYTAPCIFVKSGKVDACVVVNMSFSKHTACFHDFQGILMFLWILGNVSSILTHFLDFQ